MNSIAQIIEHNRHRMADTDVEINRLLETLPGRHTTQADIDKWIAGWRDYKAICRDTISYLETLVRIQSEAAA